MGSRLRRAILRVGKDVRAPVNRVLARHSEVGDPAIFDRTAFAWVERLEAAWPAIAKEAERVLAVRDDVPPLAAISPDHGRIARGDRWRSYVLWGWGLRQDGHCARCPGTTRVIESIPGLATAFFSVLRPGTHLPRHKGLSKALVTCHLPLVVPADAAGCRIDVDGTRHHWVPGRCFLFDDTRPHEAWNETAEERVVLLLHVRRPLRLPGALLARAFLGAVRRSPYARDAQRNQDAWDARIAARDRVPTRA